MIIGYINSDAVIERFKGSPIANVPMQSESKLTERIWDALDYIAATELYEETILRLDIVEGSAKLPKNIRRVVSVKVVKSGQTLLNTPLYPDSYMVKDNRIYVDDTIELIEVKVIAIKQDSTGRPLIPNQTEYIDAVTTYLMWKSAEDGWYLNAVTPDKVEYLKRNLAVRIQAARNVQRISTQDEMKALGRIINRPML